MVVEISESVNVEGGDNPGEGEGDNIEIDVDEEDVDEKGRGGVGDALEIADEPFSAGSFIGEADVGSGLGVMPNLKNSVI